MRSRFRRSFSVLLIALLPGCMPMPGMMGMMMPGMMPGMGMPMPVGSPNPAGGPASIANSCESLTIALADPEMPATTKVQMQQAMAAAGCPL